jgi:transposase
VLQRPIEFGQFRNQSEGRVFYDRKIVEGKTHKEAIRALKRQISDRVFRHLIADAQQLAGS